MTQAPPTVPGIPAANSNPVRPHFKARLAALESSTPEPARRISPSASSSRSNRLVLTMRPGYPWSLTRRLLPFPTMYQGSPAFWKRADQRPPAPLPSSGSAYQAAGPPARNVGMHLHWFIDPYFHETSCQLFLGQVRLDPVIKLFGRIVAHLFLAVVDSRRLPRSLPGFFPDGWGSSWQITLLPRNSVYWSSMPRRSYSLLLSHSSRLDHHVDGLGILDALHAEQGLHVDDPDAAELNEMAA